MSHDLLDTFASHADLVHGIGTDCWTQNCRTQWQSFPDFQTLNSNESSHGLTEKTAVTIFFLFHFYGWDSELPLVEWK